MLSHGRAPGTGRSADAAASPYRGCVQSRGAGHANQGPWRTGVLLKNSVGQDPGHFCDTFTSQWLSLELGREKD